VAAAIPIDAPGVSLLLGRQPSDGRRGTSDAGNIQFGGQECVVWFDDVFVPNERVFLDGHLEASATLLQAFAGFHRASYGGCKPGNFDVLIGATAALTEESGVRDRPGVRDKLVEMVHLSETISGLGMAASHKSTRHASGVWQVDPMLANVCKQSVTRLPYEIGRIAEDLAGGLMATLPALEAFEHPRLQGIMNNIAVSKTRARLLRLVEFMTYGAGALPLRLECMHGAGSPAAQRISIERTADWAGYVSAARKLAGLEELAQHSGAAK
jgi:4-hydroxybutyryl-CoA dehydratase/vinylacetyl-CoA-Delta-isomerase